MSIIGNNKVASSQFVRDNGFNKPYNKYQVTTWLVMILFGLFCFAVEIPALNPSGWLPAYLAIGIVYAIVFALVATATAIDPSDDNSLRHRRKAAGAPVPVFDRSKHKHVIEEGYCHICQCMVLEASKHCQPCNKCVKGFDHHCMWLNNCVGTKNYKLFLMLLLFALIGGVGMLVIGIFVFVSGFIPGSSLYQDVWWRKLPGGFPTFQTLIAIKIVFLLVACGLVAQLLIFHVMIIKRGQSTYSYFKLREAKKAELRAKQEKSDSTQLTEVVVERPTDYDNMPMPACTDPPTQDQFEMVNTVDGPRFSSINMSYTEQMA